MTFGWILFIALLLSGEDVVFVLWIIYLIFYT